MRPVAFGQHSYGLSSSTSVGGSFSGTTSVLVDVVGGYDFVGPRTEVEVGFGLIPFTANLTGTAARSNFSGDAHQLHLMGKVLHDFIPASTLTPYIGAVQVRATRRRPRSRAAGRRPALLHGVLRLG
jgi:hypothetical protein